MTIPNDEALRQAIPDDPEIQAEYDRLQSLFTGADPEKLALMGKMIARAAFLGITIDRLERDIAQNGYRETYQNGATQSGYKKSTAADLLPTYSKLFVSVMKELRAALIPEASNSLADEFDQF